MSSSEPQVGSVFVIAVVIVIAILEAYLLHAGQTGWH